MGDTVDVVVIGSGFGGATAAKRLVEAGCTVVMLERGPWRDTLPNRSIGMADLAPLPQGAKAFTHGLRSVRSHLSKRQLLLNHRGYVEAYHGVGINVVCSSNVGGGSHIYAGMLARPSDPSYWDGHHPQVNQAGMDRYYSEIIQQLGARAATESDQVPNRISLTDHDGKLSCEGLPNPLLGFLLPQSPGAPVKVTDANGVERWECDYLNNSVLGSFSGAKTTLDFAVVWPAVKMGLVVHDLCEATSIIALKNAVPGTEGYEVRYHNHRDGTLQSIKARRVVLAAGCLNTVSLLFKSRDEARGLQGMPMLGQKFGTNGGFFGFWRENAPVDLSRGLPLSGPFRSKQSPSKQAQVLRAAIQGIDAIPMPRWLRRWLGRNAFIVTLGKDRNTGSIAFNKGRLAIRYDKAESPVYQEIDYERRTIEHTTGTRIYAPRAPITVQPLGGACLGATADDGVVGANGEIFDNPGLYVADAAALPESPGRPPSLTIAVWATHVADCLIAETRREQAGHPMQDSLS